MEENKRENSMNQQQIVGAIVLVGIIIAGAILLKGSSAPVANTNNNVNNNINPPATVAFAGRAVSNNDHLLGNRNAKIVIVEYSDLECPFCRLFHATMHQVMDNNPSVAWVYRHYPIPQLHQKATREAEASECAWKQGGNDAFWKYIDRVFEITPSNDGLADSELPEIAAYIGLNVDSFNNCLNSGEMAAKVQADVDDGVKAGVNGTPSSFILVSGKKADIIAGAQPYEKIQAQLDLLK